MQNYFQGGVFMGHSYFFTLNNSFSPSEVVIKSSSTKEPLLFWDVLIPNAVGVNLDN